MSSSSSNPSSAGGAPAWQRAAAGAALSVGAAAAALLAARWAGGAGGQQRAQADRKNQLVRQASQSKQRMSAAEKRTYREQRRARQLEEAYTQASRRRTVVLERELGDVTVREFEGVRACRGVPIVEGFPASGLCSSLAANYLVSHLELPLVGEIVSDAFPALGVVSRYTASSGCRIYGDERLVVFVTEFKVKEEDGGSSVVADLVEAVYDFAARHGSRLILTAEGLARKSSINKSDYETQEELLMAMLQQMNEANGADGDDEEKRAMIEAALEEKALEKLAAAAGREDSSSTPSSSGGGGGDDGGKKRRKKRRKAGADSDSEDESDDEPEDGEIRFVCNDSAFALRMKDLGHLPMKEGMLNGVTGGILARASTAEPTVVCILSPYDEALPDASATLPIIQCIDSILGDDIVIDTTDLAREVRHIERDLRKAIEEMVPKSGVTSKDRHMSMYM